MIPVKSRLAQFIVIFKHPYSKSIRDYLKNTGEIMTKWMHLVRNYNLCHMLS